MISWFSSFWYYSEIVDEEEEQLGCYVRFAGRNYPNDKKLLIKSDGDGNFVSLHEQITNKLKSLKKTNTRPQIIVFQTKHPVLRELLQKTTRK